MKKLLTLSILSILVILFIFVNSTPAQAQSTGPYTITKISGDNQVLDLQPSGYGEGGSEFMVPQVVQVTDSSGNPAAGVAVTFQAAYSHPIYPTMPPHGDRSVTKTTDSNGMASASNNFHAYAGQGFQVYSIQVAVTRTLQVTASVSGATPVVFQVTANAVPIPPQPLTVTKIAGDNQTINLTDTSRFAGGEALTAPMTVEVKDANGNPVAGVWFHAQGAVNDSQSFNMTVTAGSSQTKMVTGSNGRATYCCASMAAYRINTSGSYTFALTPEGGWPTNSVTFNGDIISWSPPPPSTPGTLYPVSPSLQQLQLVPGPNIGDVGGEAFMVPQQVIAKDANGNPIPGVTVSFEAIYSHPIYPTMPPHGARVITRVTNANGIATASNTFSSYVGKGYLVYGIQTGQIKTLQVRASVIGWNTVTFNVQAATIGATLTDTTPPNITASAMKSGGGGYPAGQWTNQDVIVHYNATDALSSIQSVTPDQTFSNEGANQSATGAATDSAGNSASVTFMPINIDKTGPTMTLSAKTALGAQYVAGQWTNQAVIVHYEAQDGLSGVATLSPDETISNEGTTQSASGSATDFAGNSSSATFSPINIDMTNPVTTATLTAANSQPYTPGMSTTSVTIDLTPTDALSGVILTQYTVDNGPPQPGTSFQVSGVGSYDIQYWSTDAAGNVETPQNLSIVLPLIVDAGGPYSGIEGSAITIGASVITALPINIGGTFTPSEDVTFQGNPAYELGTNREPFLITGKAGAAGNLSFYALVPKWNAAAKCGSIQDKSANLFGYLNGSPLGSMASNWQVSDATWIQRNVSVSAGDFELELSAGEGDGCGWPAGTDPFYISTISLIGGLSYSFDCDNDGTFEAIAQPSSSYDCSYANDGIFDVLVSVTDPVNSTTSSDTATVTVSPANTPTGSDVPVQPVDTTTARHPLR